ncbi:MAG TPA: hypothetical protein VFU15_04725 [Bacteroidia bacterium]|nr:hypothetical protein [Bacteroidia bacterium]
MNVSSGESNGEYHFPSSYYVPASYWQKSDSMHPELLHAKIGCYQRLIIHYGLNLYCAACRQLALLTTEHPEAWEAIDAHTRLLLNGTIGETGCIRAWSDEGGMWQYGDNGTTFNRADNGAYFFGVISDRFSLADPFTAQTHFPAGQGGSRLEWIFYDPFLGENTWAALIAPMQVLFRRRSVEPTALSGNPAELQLAMSLIPACRAMQSRVGGVYARPAPHGKPLERLISNETNLTLYAGLCMMCQLFPEISADPAVKELMEGLLSYFRTVLFGREEDGRLRMHTCGSFTGDEFHPGIAADGEPARFAVDVHTWGMSILGVDEIDTMHGTGTCFELWQSVKQHAGFYPSQQPGEPIRGVGYSSGALGDPVHDICSPEWTFGAINMCRILAAEYDAPGQHYAPHLAKQLREDEKNMLDGVASFESSSELERNARSYPYVNKRCETGFGWHAFPVESLCATSWAILVRNGFNPFRTGGACLSTLNNRISSTTKA